MVKKKELEEKRRKEEEDTAHVFEEFIETFQQPTDRTILNKVWVKSGVFNGKEDSTPGQSVYKPSSKYKSSDPKTSILQAQECARILSVDRKKNEVHKKKKSNLESFKEELEMLHRERQERQRLKAETHLPLDENPIGDPDPFTTNLYVNNLNPKVTEVTLMELFGSFGPLASIKIMWPRSEEEKSRSKSNCGFVAFMSRKDAERAIQGLDNTKFMDYELKVGWGKPVILPPYPIFIPNSLLEMVQPPPKTGLPFNAQPVSISTTSLKDCIVKVVVPTNKNVLMLIHRMIEFVLREGLLFEAIMMTREINNPQFSFLFDNQSPAHIYYRWKLFSILQGDSLRHWRTSEFRMFQDGPIWQPPKMIDYTQGMPEDLIKIKPLKSELKKNLSNAQRDNLEHILHRLGPERKSIAGALIYCVDHSAAAEEIVECLIQALESKSASMKKVVARLYLLNDLFYNSQGVPKAQIYSKLIHKEVAHVVNILKMFYEQLVNKEKQTFYLKISRVFNAWKRLNLLPSGEIDLIYKTFMNMTPEESEPTPRIEYKEILPKKLPEVPKVEKLPVFAPSRWEIVDPDLIEAQAMTTSKWSEYIHSDIHSLELDHKRELSEEKRRKLRDIELLVMEYQDNLENNCKANIHKNVIFEKVEEFRNKLIKEYEKEEKYHHKKHKKRRKSRSRSPKRKYNKHC